MTSMNNKLEISNFPEEHTIDMIEEICKIFGKVKQIDMIKDPNTSRFKGIVHVEYSSEGEAKYAFSSMMGLKIEENRLFVKKITSISAPTQDGNGEMFKALIEDKPTSCLQLRNVLQIEEIEERMDYKELEFDVQDEMKKYGDCR
jgi:RNA recognition motif-containing protein